MIQFAHQLLHQHAFRVVRIGLGELVPTLWPGRLEVTQEIKHLLSELSKLKDTFILMCSAQFFNAITPFSSGGQPFQIYLLKKQGIKVTDSGNALLQNFFTYQLALIIMGTFAVVTNSFLHIIPSTSLLKNIVLIGYIVNIIVLILLFSLGRAKNLNTKVFNKIVKDYT